MFFLDVSEDIRSRSRTLFGSRVKTFLLLLNGSLIIIYIFYRSAAGFRSLDWDPDSCALQRRCFDRECLSETPRVKLNWHSSSIFRLVFRRFRISMLYNQTLQKHFQPLGWGMNHSYLYSDFSILFIEFFVLLCCDGWCVISVCVCVCADSVLQTKLASGNQ